MRISALEIFLAVSLTLGAVVSLVLPANASDLVIKAAFARASTSPKARTGVVYFTLINRSGSDDRLIGVSSDAAERADLHASVANGDVMTMEPVAAVPMPQGATAVLAPGGLHVMLWDLKAPLKQGERIVLHLQFERAGNLDVEVPVMAAGATGP